MKSPCDHRERGRRSDVEAKARWSECASGVSVANNKRRRGESRGGAKANVRARVSVGGSEPGVSRASGVSVALAVRAECLRIIKCNIHLSMIKIVDI